MNDFIIPSEKKIDNQEEFGKAPFN